MGRLIGQPPPQRRRDPAHSGPNQRHSPARRPPPEQQPASPCPSQRSVNQHRADQVAVTAAVALSASATTLDASPNQIARRAIAWLAPSMAAQVQNPPDRRTRRPMDNLVHAPCVPDSNRRPGRRHRSTSGLCGDRLPPTCGHHHRKGAQRMEGLPHPEHRVHDPEQRRRQLASCPDPRGRLIAITPRESHMPHATRRRLPLEMPQSGCWIWQGLEHGY